MNLAAVSMSREMTLVWNSRRATWRGELLQEGWKEGREAVGRNGGREVGMGGWVEEHPHRSRGRQNGLGYFREWGKLGKVITFEI